jgi:ribosomal protein L32E
MVRSTPLLRKKIEHKRTARFTRFQSDLYGGRLAASWRRPRGIDSLIIQVSITE